MTFVLVTGPAGSLGSVLVPLLLGRGHRVRIMAHQKAPKYGPGVDLVRGDVRQAADFAKAADGVEAIIHTATSVFRKATATEIQGTTAAVAAARSASAHLVYPSIVGVDAIGGTYYRAKRQAERILEGAPSWTIQRATQLHPTLNRTVGRIFPATSHLAFQPLDPGELAERLIDHAEAGPACRAENLAGPEVIKIKELVAVRRSVTGMRTILISVPALGPLRSLDAGYQLSSEGARGRITWRQWLTEKRPPSVRIGAPNQTTSVAIVPDQPAEP